MADKPAFDPSGAYNKPKFDPNAPIGAAQVSPEQAQIAALPNAAQQAKAQTQNATPLGPNPTNLVDLAESQVATPNHNHFEKLAPLVAGSGAAGLVEGAVAKIAAAGAGGAGGDAAAQLTTTGKVNPIQSAEAGAGMAVGEGAGQVLSPIAKWIASSKGSGARLLQAALDKAGSAPVELSPETNKIMEQIMQQDRSGNTAPKVVKDLLARVGPNPTAPANAEPGPLTYGEARNFQSNASRLSSGEAMNAKGSMKSLMAQFSKSLSGDVQAAADSAGAGDIHRAGMQQYAAASSRNQAASVAGKAALGLTAGGGGVLGAIEVLKKFGVLK